MCMYCLRICCFSLTSAFFISVQKEHHTDWKFFVHTLSLFALGLNFLQVSSTPKWIWSWNHSENTWSSTSCRRGRSVGKCANIMGKHICVWLGIHIVSSSFEWWASLHNFAVFMLTWFLPDQPVTFKDCSVWAKNSATVFSVTSSPFFMLEAENKSLNLHPKLTFWCCYSSAASHYLLSYC